MEITYLQNEYVRVGIRPLGAELASFQKVDTGLEYIWQADPAFWARHAPVLFPIVGKLAHNQYTYQSKTYTLPQHGFARDQVFQLKAHQPDRLVFELVPNGHTLAVYPFEFNLQVSYTLQGQSLEVKWQVRHNGLGQMPFSIGAHPAFNVPLLPDVAFEDYYLEFSQPETLSRHLLDSETGLFSGQTEPVLDNLAILPLRYEHYAKDAIVFKDFRSERVTLKSDRHPHFVQMTFPGFPYLGIWTKQVGAPFLCLEPWFGLADRVDASGDLFEKEGIQILSTGQNFEAAYTIAVG